MDLDKFAEKVNRWFVILFMILIMTLVMGDAVLWGVHILRLDYIKWFTK